MSARRQQLLRQLEGHMRQCKGRADIRRELAQTGMTAGDIWKFECAVRRQLREERTERRAA